MKPSKRINKFLALAYWLVLIGLLGYMIYYNDSLQRQIYERDIIIQKLAFSDTLVHKYFNIETDSLNQYKTYILKDEYSSKEIHHYTTKTITKYLEDTSMIQAQYQQLISLREKYNHLVDSYNSLVEESKRLHFKYQNLADSIKMKNMALSLIKKNYEISHDGKIDSNHIQVRINSKKADSAFMLLPFYRNKLKYNSKKDIWEISKGIW